MYYSKQPSNVINYNRAKSLTPDKHKYNSISYNFKIVSEQLFQFPDHYEQHRINLIQDYHKKIE